MILAAADFAESENKKSVDRKEAPRELRMAFQFEVYGLTKPASETEAGLMAKMTACLNVYKAIHERNVFVFSMLKPDTEFTKRYPEFQSIRRSVDKLRERIDGKS